MIKGGRARGHKCKDTHFHNIAAVHHPPISGHLNLMSIQMGKEQGALQPPFKTPRCTSMASRVRNAQKVPPAVEGLLLRVHHWLLSPCCACPKPQLDKTFLVDHPAIEPHEGAAGLRMCAKHVAWCGSEVK